MCVEWGHSSDSDYHRARWQDSKKWNFNLLLSVRVWVRVCNAVGGHTRAEEYYGHPPTGGGPGKFPQTVWNWFLLLVVAARRRWQRKITLVKVVARSVHLLEMHADDIFVSLFTVVHTLAVWHRFCQVEHVSASDRCSCSANKRCTIAQRKNDHHRSQKGSIRNQHEKVR